MDFTERWKEALRYWSIKRRHKNKIIKIDNKYYYEGVLLQEKKNGKYHYIIYYYKIQE